ncbi:MAG: hypothetical protein PG981_001438 [Wolbachia endosymbiont of Ctenocephalides orientis wCori]|nr:MAG: hypothetical protein PG981_001438 [Wolbachia endosymbiont of Ctenocephalides orientis wCori]
MSKKQRKQIEELNNYQRWTAIVRESMSKAGLESLRYKAAKGRIDKIYLFSPEDLVKDFRDQMRLLREFWKSGVEIIFLSEKVTVEEDLISFSSSYGW